MMDKCSFPGCDRDIAGGFKMRSERYLCFEHGEDCYFLDTEMEKQAAVVSALAHAVLAGFDSFDTTLKKETRRLIAMQSRRIQYLKLAGFDRVDEGVE